MAGTDDWKGMGQFRADYEHAAAISKSDSTELPHYCRAIYVGGAGDVIVDTVGGETDITFKAPPVGSIIPIRAIKVKNATTATLLLALW